MTGVAAHFAFAGNALLRPQPEYLLALARELGDEELAGSIECAQESLEQEYNRLFLNPAGSSCPLWQSACADEPRLMGDAHLRALEWFRRHGMSPSAGNDPADHIGLLLLFYGWLLRSGAEYSELVAFREQHLAWAAALFSRIEESSRHPFYRVLARKTSILLVDPSASERDAVSVTGGRKCNETK